MSNGERTLVLGGDGFCGWPTALHLADNGHQVTIVDNLSRRRIDEELGVESLTPVTPIEERLAVWEEVAGPDKKIDFVNIDIAHDYDSLEQLVGDTKPDSIIHFAEQRAAPYSMKDARTMRYTIDNNNNATGNVLIANVETGLKSHIVHLGTMGVYGYGWTGKAPIPEGYVQVKIPTPDGVLDREILHPANPGSVYHMTKTQDQLAFAFFQKNFDMRITDLHQGIVWGTQTPQTERDERLINRFDYDGDYGTVLNRFLVQAAIGYPLTVHGTGGQTRAFINIRDTVQCIELATQTPPQAGDRVSIFNQVTESHRVRDLARMIAKMSGVEISNVENPRKEAAENELQVSHDRFGHLYERFGIQPTTLSEGLMKEIEGIALKYADRLDESKIPATSQWVKK